MRKKLLDNVLESIGNTPMIKINKLTADFPCPVYAKVETTNPGNSVKDRMALKMIEDAEKNGLLKPGATIIEGTSGNTGMGLAIAAVVKGYKCIFTTTDKQSKEKVDILRAFGAEVIICPTAVAPDDPRSYYSVASRLNKEIPGSYYPNQYDNPSNAVAHYESTGPEIWEQTDGKITHFVVGVGTGGTISGVGKYLKEQNPDIQIMGIDTYGSVFKKYHETGIFDEAEIYPYITEGIGEDILPKNVDFDVIDYFEKVSDKDAANYTRELARKEGLFVGNSAGSAIGGILQMKDKFKAGDLVVVLFHDHGSRYVGKMFNDDWMRSLGFLDEKLTIKDIINSRPKQDLVKVKSEDSVLDAVNIMKHNDISQIPVMDNGVVLGAIDESTILNNLLENAESKSWKVSKIMKEAMPVVEFDSPCDQLNSYFNKVNGAVLSKDTVGQWHIITKYDVIQALN